MRSLRFTPRGSEKRALGNMVDFGLPSIDDRVSNTEHRLSIIVSKALKLRKTSGYCGINLGSLWNVPLAHPGTFWVHFGTTLALCVDLIIKLRGRFCTILVHFELTLESLWSHFWHVKVTWESHWSALGPHWSTLWHYM